MSSISCNAPMPTDSAKKPKKSNGVSLVFVSRMKSQMPANDRMPIGRLM